MTYNVEFKRDGVDPGDGNSQIDFDWRGDPVEAGARMDEIAAIIRKADPDVALLVEVENEDSIKALNSRLSGMGYEVVFVQGIDTFTGQDLALLTRIDPEFAERWTAPGISGTTSKSVSKNLRAAFETSNGFRFSLLGLHFLSRPSDNSRKNDRQAQANAIVGSALALSDSGTIVVLGDFNDYDGEGLDLSSCEPITTVVSSIKALDPTTKEDNLFNVAEPLEPQVRFTSHWDKDDDETIDEGELTSIDHILVSELSRPLLASVVILNDPSAGQPSDHYPIAAEFDLSDGVEKATPPTEPFDSVFIRYEGTDRVEKLSGVEDVTASQIVTDFENSSSKKRYDFGAHGVPNSVVIDWSKVAQLLVMKR